MNNENTFFYILLSIVVIGFAIPFVQAHFIRNKNARIKMQKHQAPPYPIDHANAYRVGLPSEYYDRISPTYEAGG